MAKKTKNNERRRPKRLGRTGRRSAASIGGATGFSSSATEGRLLQKGKNWEKRNPLKDCWLGKFSLLKRARCIVIFLRLTLFSLISLKHHVTIHSSYLNPSLIPSGSCSDRNFGTINWMRLNLSVTFCTLQPPPGATRKRSEKVGRVSSLSVYFTHTRAQI